MSAHAKTAARGDQDVASSRRRWVTLAAALLTACGLLGTALSPYLMVEHPLLLVGLNPDGRHLLMVAGRVEPWQALTVASLRRALALLAAFGVATVHGELIVSWLGKKMPRVSRLLPLAEAIYARIGIWLVVLAPFSSVAVFAGIARMSWRRFVLAIAPGQVVVVLATQWFGEAIETWTAPVIAFVEQHSLEATLVAASLVVMQQLWTRLLGRSDELNQTSLRTSQCGAR